MLKAIATGADPAQYTTTYDYDPAGSLTKKKTPRGSTS
ncbi:hypothetical protein [Streptomyces sp. KS_5]